MTTYGTYQKTVSIACINFNTLWGDQTATLEKMKWYIEEAAKQGNDIVVFPESALCGFECDEEGTTQRKPCAMHRDAAETIPGPSTEEIARLASALDIYVVFGMAEQDKHNPNVHYNASVVISPEKILGAYRKVTLSPPPLFSESFCSTPGEELPIFETEFGPIGVQICYDFLLMPELSRILALKGARLIINTTASPSGPWKPYFLAQQTGARASENLIYCASANQVGKGRVTSFAGGSVIAGPLGTQLAFVYAQASDHSEEMVSATLDFERLERIRELIPWRKNRRGELIAREMQNFAGQPSTESVLSLRP